MTAYPTVIQQAVDYGRRLPAVQVLVDDLRGVPNSDTIDLDFLFNVPGDSIELGTTWAPCPDDWRLVYAGYRTFSRQDDRHRLATWDDVRAFLDSHTTALDS
ncbi:hypothetical protein [Nonomuraea sp. NPDC023979]|uniref:hypothetical protein n=1 Tax=Nonomuraea sp. NPDC023979 TaxID=3154796 RepID=UPI0033D010AF